MHCHISAAGVESFRRKVLYPEIFDHFRWQFGSLILREVGRVEEDQYWLFVTIMFSQQKKLLAI